MENFKYNNESFIMPSFDPFRTSWFECSSCRNPLFEKQIMSKIPHICPHCGVHLENIICDEQVFHILYKTGNIVSQDDKRDRFMNCVANSVNDDASETLLNVYSEISNKAVDDGLSLDDYDMTAEDLKKTLMEYNISSEYADNIVDVCMEFSDDNKIKANDIVDDKVLKKNELYIAYKKLLAENEELKKQLALLK